MHDRFAFILGDMLEFDGKMVREVFKKKDR
jgi:hypothetical protein